jgi:hypothetical protein
VPARLRGGHVSGILVAFGRRGGGQLTVQRLAGGTRASWGGTESGVERTSMDELAVGYKTGGSSDGIRPSVCVWNTLSAQPTVGKRLVPSGAV